MTPDEQNRRMKKLLKQIAGSKFTKQAPSAFNALIAIQEAVSVLLKEIDNDETNGDTE